MRCQKCAKENADRRKFCSECGELIVAYCKHCGFDNALTDKYCGGCGVNLTEAMILPDRQAPKQVQSPAGTGKYSYDDISELIQEKTARTKPSDKKKEIKGADSVSQDLLDSIFDAADD
ncbi:MAG: zinc ribbon domain-containing protein [Nitrospirae bacterium]|nr:zinc ribbon domain-containing protein [Nitrospirota bacterium]